MKEKQELYKKKKQPKADKTKGNSKKAREIKKSTNKGILLLILGIPVELKKEELLFQQAVTKGNQF
ncbi:25750_t:CDS:2 [Gigaspora rosea]|nr:25750_t:CDS:2 [Gigaspora rosea]